MGGSQAAKVLMQIESASLKKQGKEVSEEDAKAMYEKIKGRYDEQTSPYYAAARLWLYAIIEPKDTRKWISMGIEAANNTPTGEYKVGVIQT